MKKFYVVLQADAGTKELQLEVNANNKYSAVKRAIKFVKTDPVEHKFLGSVFWVKDILTN